MGEKNAVEKRDFFISYNEYSENWAEKIAQILVDNGYTVYIQMWDTLPGDDFIEKMNEFLENSRGFVAVVSHRYFNSENCKKEWRAAYNKNSTTNGEYQFFPFRVENADIPVLMQTIVYKNIYGTEDMENAVLQTVSKKPMRTKTTPIAP